MHAPALEDVFRRTTREQSPDPELRQQCVKTIHREATRLDAVYRLQLEAVSRARSMEAALFIELLQTLKPALPALVSPLLVLDVSAPNRPELVHLRAFILFGETPHLHLRASQMPVEALFVLEDASLLRVRFTGATAATKAGPRALVANRLEGLDVRGVLRDHPVQDVVDVLVRGITAQAARRQALVGKLEAHLARLQALRALLAH